ncbi:MAG: HmuY family protein [Bacteroidetes bacterium]|nr:HmuY family protein [Bacteroidota bacterium]
MNIFKLFIPTIVAVSLIFASCEKHDTPISLPEKNSAAHATVDMGEDYTDQIFYDIETQKVVYTSAVNSWDLAFEASPSGYHIFMNEGKMMFAYNTHETNMDKVNAPPKIKDSEWGFDASCGLPDSTGIGDCRMSRGSGSKNEVYILKLNSTLVPDTFKKMQILAVTEDKYVIAYADLKGGPIKTVTIPKNDNYNRVYYSLVDNALTNPEPPKNTYDIVFTRYMIIFYNNPLLKAFQPYLVSGPLLNPMNVTAICDSLTPYKNITADKIPTIKLSNHRDAIGYDWKSYDYIKGRYTVKPEKVYIIKTRSNYYYKLHFLDFYSPQGVKGSPSFEFERIL